ncbi:uncharacterized protein LOC129287099 isoform X3 [Prosopis cineraria]|uniref:uncharacterized protein LOC129287099 isoform X3 n=1 Tax=Prosopis cineraria TaxID=364024 RepID=UPI00240FBFB9|nr:uncharacterized protein LOC129287099 isoform X3 [Prosopis cineraria]
MVELQSRATLVNVSALSAELQRERQKNAELMRRISVLEAQIRDRNKKEETILVTDIGQGKNEAASNYKRSKRRKLEMVGDIKEKGNREDFKSDMTSQNNAAERSLVNWMSIDDTQNLHLEKFKDSDCAGDFDETDSDDNYDDHDHIDNGHRNAEVDVRQEEHEHQKMNEVKTHEETEIEETEGYYCTAAPQEARSSGFTSVPNRNRLKEHVLYENPGVRRKIFYPNRENPILCPVQILEEERLMRPSDASCPSCLFLCIKYGGRTRNLPQNEYVRQRMGRNKLKSFGPMICRMAILAHIRSGSFFFKALGITLLFMAGFPDNIVQRETKYRNLDLLQKYYRKDEDAAEEELFLPRPIACDNHVTAETQSSTRKSLLAKAGGKKHTNSMNRSQSLQIQMKTSAGQSIPASSGPSQFGLTGYSSSHTLAMAAFHSAIPSQISQNTSQTTNKHASYQMLPPQPTSAYVPLVYWPPPPSTFPFAFLLLQITSPSSHSLTSIIQPIVPQ